MRTTPFLSVMRAAHARRARRPRLANAARFAKRNCAAVLLCVATLPSGARATVIENAWHLGPVPAVRTVCHAGDTLWVGTAAGLFLVDVRDGSVMQRIEAGGQLPSSSVRGIAATGDSVFVATDDGLALFRGGVATTFTPRDPGALPMVPLKALHGVSIGRDREVLLATLGSGAGVITPAGGFAITRADSLMDDIVFDVRDTPAGPRYFATNAGLCAQLGDTTFAWYQAGTGLPRGETRQLAVSPDGAVYVLVSRIGVYRFDNARALQLPSPAGVALADARSISIGPDGTLWVAGRGWIVARRGSEWRRVDTREDAGESWLTVQADGAGAFAGSEDGTLVAIGRGSPLRVKFGDGLPAPRVAAIAPDGHDGAWFVCGGRLARADYRARRLSFENIPADVRAVTVGADGVVAAAGRWTVRRRGTDGWRDLDPDVTGADPAFTAARYDADGALWVGTRAGDIYRFDGEIWMRMARGSQTLDGGAIADVQSAPGGAWAVGAGIPVRCAEGRVQRFSGIDSTESVVGLERGPGGRWIAITPGSVYVFDDDANTWRRSGVIELVGGTGKAGIEGSLTALAFDRSGMLFLGSSEGLGVVTAQGVRWLHAADGLGGGSVAGLALDAERLWVGFARDGMTVLPLDHLP